MYQSLACLSFHRKQHNHVSLINWKEHSICQKQFLHNFFFLIVISKSLQEVSACICNNSVGCDKRKMGRPCFLHMEGLNAAAFILDKNRCLTFEWLISFLSFECKYCRNTFSVKVFCLKHRKHHLMEIQKY